MLRSNNAPVPNPLQDLSPFLPLPGGREGGREGQGGREEEEVGLLTAYNKRQKAGKHNALSSNTTLGARGPVCERTRGVAGASTRVSKLYPATILHST